MQDWLEGLLGIVAAKKVIPFACMAGTKPELNTARIIEALIIAAFSGLIGGMLASQMTISKIEERVSGQGREIAEIKADKNREIAEIKADIGKIKNDIYMPIAKGQ